MRTPTEVKLLSIRQTYIDALDLLMSRAPICLKHYKYLKLKLMVCEELLKETRAKKYIRQV